MERAQVDVHSVAMLILDGGYLYARITTFSDTTAEDFAAGIARLRRDLNAKPRGVVIDLRNNPGGVLESAVEVADQLLERASSSPPKAARRPRVSAWMRRPVTFCPACAWWCWSMAPLPPRPRSSPARCRIIAARYC